LFQQAEFVVKGTGNSMSLQTPVGHANIPADRWSSRAPFLVVAGVVVVSVVAIYLIGLSLLRTNDQIIQSQRRVEHAERLVWSLIDAERWLASMETGNPNEPMRLQWSVG